MQDKHSGFFTLNHHFPNLLRSMCYTHIPTQTFLISIDSLVSDRLSCIKWAKNAQRCLPSMQLSFVFHLVHQIFFPLLGINVEKETQWTHKNGIKLLKRFFLHLLSNVIISVCMKIPKTVTQSPPWISKQPLLKMCVDAGSLRERSFIPPKGFEFKEFERNSWQIEKFEVKVQKTQSGGECQKKKKLKLFGARPPFRFRCLDRGSLQTRAVWPACSL